jgi:hypothetical protein
VALFERLDKKSAVILTIAVETVALVLTPAGLTMLRRPTLG